MALHRVPTYVLLVVLWVWAAPSIAEATPYGINDGSFVADVYDFSYRSSTNSANNGGTTVAGAPWHTNSGWTLATRAGSSHWRLPGSDFQRYYGSGVSGTVGFDFSGMSGSLSSVEINPANLLFTYFPNPTTPPGTALDTIRGEVATPASMGTGTFTSAYSYVGITGGGPPFSIGQDASDGLLDITPLLSSSWLANPGLLEFRFSYSQYLPVGSPSSELGPAIAEDIQLFRDAGSNTGFQLRATMVEVIPEPSTLALLALGGVVLVWRRRRR